MLYGSFREWPRLYIKENIPSGKKTSFQVSHRNHHSKEHLNVEVLTRVFHFLDNFIAYWLQNKQKTSVSFALFSTRGKFRKISSAKQGKARKDKSYNFGLMGQESSGDCIVSFMTANPRSPGHMMAFNLV